MPETLEFISFVPWEAIIMVLNAFILYKLVRHFLFKRVQAIFEQRQQEVDRVYAEADRAKADSEAAKSQYEARLAEAHKEAAEVVESALKNARLKENEIVGQANQQAEYLIKKAQADIEQTEKKAVAQLKDDVSVMAVSIAGKIAKKEIKQEDHERLIEECMEHFREDAV
ncbi:F0F1 ATP synthase subunit B [Scatolibacter rhodanostii]|uniref:F0F1 ATP synthase subunit B n=1 Tax=Scatolibacter rhodanostii TaxID=2014781 RepID=UPI000C080DCB|nr:F0F1 ATP synthase subunit B [Scatolibacter rhodanostii]